MWGERGKEKKKKKKKLDYVCHLQRKWDLEMFLSSSKAKRAINWENTCSRTSKMNSTMVSAASSPSYSMTSSSVKMKMLSDSLRPGGRERRSPDPSKGHTQVGLIF